MNAIDHIYASMLGEHPWTAFLENLTDNIPAGKATLQMYDYTNPENSFVALQSGFEDSALEEYALHYSKLNVLQQALARKPNFVGISDKDLVSKEVRKKNSFFNEWLEPNEIKSSAGIKVNGSGSQAISLVLLSGEDSDECRSKMADTLTGLSPHLQRAVDFYRRIKHPDVNNDFSQGLVDTFGMGFILINADCRIDVINNNAQKMLEEASFPLSFKSCRLHISDGELSSKISEMTKIRYAGPKSCDYYFPGVKVSLHRPDKDNMDMLFNGASCMILINGISKKPLRFDRKLIARTYCLTAAEMRAADGVIQGKSAAEIAQEAGLSRETIRVQVRSLYAKMGAHSQADVIRLVRPH